MGLLALSRMKLKMQKQFEKIILALDTTDNGKINSILSSLQDYISVVKIGFQSFIYFGHEIVKRVQDKGFEVFLDLKLHDIPNTVEKAVESAAKLKVSMLTVHITGGKEMLKQACDIAKKINGPKILGVTVLTSMDDNIMKELCFCKQVAELVPYFASYGSKEGIDGVISSPYEIELIRRQCGNNFLIVTPGIRFSAGLDDQKRTMSPQEAIKKGADYLVVGRPILESKDPKSFFDKLVL